MSDKCENIDTDKKPKRTRAKKQPPSKEEVLREIDETLVSLDKLVAELKDDQQKIPPNLFKNIPALVEETL
ncbi:MAG TPA: hypothetical protein VHD33_01015, partial [Legionellaceae bacterium]|nr:hypothetical protein [Legionellaceae bacterium]